MTGKETGVGPSLVAEAGVRRLLAEAGVRRLLAEAQTECGAPEGVGR